MRSILDSEPWIKSENCPICTSENIGFLYSGDRYDMKLSTYICHECYFVFTNPYPSESLILDFYENEYWNLYFKSSQTKNKDLLEARQTRCEGYYNFINREVMLSGTVNQTCHLIDFGGGEGVFTKYLKESSKYKTYLFEPSVSERKLALDNNCADLVTFDERQLIKTLVGNQQSSDLTIVSCIHVLEHLTDFPKFFNFLDNVLKYNDLIYIDVPNLLAYQHVKEIHIAHKSHFSPNTLIQLFCNYGYECAAIEEYEPSYHPASIRAIFRKVNKKVTMSYTEHVKLSLIQDIFSKISETAEIWNSPISRIKRKLKTALTHFI